MEGKETPAGTSAALTSTIIAKGLGVSWGLAILGKYTMLKIPFVILGILNWVVTRLQWICILFRLLAKVELFISYKYSYYTLLDNDPLTRKSRSFWKARIENFLSPSRNTLIHFCIVNYHQNLTPYGSFFSPCWVLQSEVIVSFKLFLLVWGISFCFPCCYQATVLLHVKGIIIFNI